MTRLGRSSPVARSLQHATVVRREMMKLESDPNWVVLSLVVLGAAMPARAQQPVTFDSVASLAAPPPSHRIAYGPDSLQFGPLRLPKGPGPHPVVMFIHGGCYLSRYTISHAVALEQALADSGYAVWSIEYRRVGNEGGGWPGTFEDVGRAADHLRELARTYP